MGQSTSLMYVMVPQGSGIATGVPGRAAPLAAANINGGEQGILLVANTVLNGGGAGFPVSILGLDDATDNQAPTNLGFTSLLEGVVARLYGYDAAGNNFDRLRSIPDNADAQAALTLGVLAMMARGEAWNGATWDRLRTNSAANLAGVTQPFALNSADPGEWAVNSEPAVSTQATATRAAGAAGVRHVCRSLHFSLAAVAAQTILSARVRDGASGAGTILWSQQIIAPAGSAVLIDLSDLNIVGSAATAMTFEWSGAPVATNFATAGGSGYSTI